VIPLLFAGLCDDAAMFPPGNAPAEQAVAGHREHRSAWYRELAGPFLAAPKQLPEVLKAARAAEVLIPLVLVVSEGPGALGAAVRATMGEPGIELLGVELACGSEGSSVEAANRAVDALNRELFEGVRGAIEVRRDPGGLRDALDVIALTPFRAKYRTGGTVAGAFPSEGELASFVAECAARKLPFKCTAGLHGATRHTDLRTGFEHHGFLNILAATHAAVLGADVEAIAQALHIRSGRELADALRLLTPDAAAETRRTFTAYGTCSISEPLDDLTALGLISRPRPK
jgi:hypothetical protein